MNLLPAILGMFAIAIFVRLVIVFRRHGKSAKPRNFVAIKADEEMIAEAKRQNAEMLQLYRKLLAKDKTLRHERINEIISIITPRNVPFGRHDVSGAFKNDDILTLEEKRSLGLNTRRKYSRRLLSFFHVHLLGDAHPLEILQHKLHTAHTLTHNKHELFKYKNADVRKVRIEVCYPCPAIKKQPKIWPIDNVPLLPLAECQTVADGDVCRCWYAAILDLPGDAT